MSSSSGSSFFMFCSEDFSSKLSIPIAFAEEFPEFVGQASVELKTESGRSWEVKIKRMNNNKWFITDGWSEFMMDNKLIELNLLIFRISGKSSLDVSIFRNDSCLEEPQSPSDDDDDDDGGDDDDDDDDGHTSARTWRFVRKIKVHHIKGLRMDIPKSFIKGTGMTTSCNTKLENVRGDRWPVTVSDRRIGVFSITRGWSKFVIDNDIQVGSFLLFEFVKNSNKVIKVTPLENEAGKRLYAQRKWGGIV